MTCDWKRIDSSMWVRTSWMVASMAGGDGALAWQVAVHVVDERRVEALLRRDDRRHHRPHQPRQQTAPAGAGGGPAAGRSHVWLSGVI